MGDGREREPGEAANLNTTAATPPRDGVPDDPRAMPGAVGSRPADPAAEAAADATAFEDTELSEAEEDAAPPGVETGGPSGTTPVGPAQRRPGG